MDVTIIGGGLAGCEATGALSRAGVRARLVEMRPARMTPAHKTELLAELVCSNSLKASAVTNASGLLKAELEIMGSLMMSAALATAVPAGGALAVDREMFARRMTETVEGMHGITLVREEITQIPADGTVIIASGPLTSDALAADVARLTASEGLFFYDAIAPVVVAESIDMGVAFRASRYGKGAGDDYINCPMDRDEYESFVGALLAGHKTAPREFEELKVFEGCLPIEVMAARGRDTLAHGPMKPVGLTDPRTGKRPHAVVQLRQDNAEATLFNMVGFQTRLTRPEQERIFRMVPGLGRAEFARLGSIHRNTFINSPRLLAPSLALRSEPRLFFAGQITGVEGYLESAAMGLIAGMNAARQAYNEAPSVPPPTTMTGALIAYVTEPARDNFQPMNANFGILAPLEAAMKKSARKQAMVDRALADMKAWKEKVE